MPWQDLPQEARDVPLSYEELIQAVKALDGERAGLVISLLNQTDLRRLSGSSAGFTSRGDASCI